MENFVKAIIEEERRILGDAIFLEIWDHQKHPGPEQLQKFYDSIKWDEERKLN